MRLSLIFEYEADRIKAKTNHDFWNENKINKKNFKIEKNMYIIKQTKYELSITKHLQNKTNKLTVNSVENDEKNNKIIMMVIIMHGNLDWWDEDMSPKKWYSASFWGDNPH